MGSRRYPEEFGIEAVQPVTERGRSVPDVTQQLRVSPPRLQERIERCSLPEAGRVGHRSQTAKNRRLKMAPRRLARDMHEALLRKGSKTSLSSGSSVSQHVLWMCHYNRKHLVNAPKYQTTVVHGCIILSLDPLQKGKPPKRLSQRRKVCARAKRHCCNPCTGRFQGNKPQEPEEDWGYFFG